MRRYYKAQFDPLCEMEPKLTLLERKLIQLGHDTRDAPTFCANREWLWIKPKVTKLVGRSAQRRRVHRELGTPRSYDIVCGYLYHLLPDCRSCVCMAIEELCGLRPPSHNGR